MFLAPKLIIEGIRGYVVYLPHVVESTTSFVASFISLYDVSSYYFEKDDGDTSFATIEVLDKSKWEIVTRFKIVFLEVSKDSDGDYILDVTDERDSIFSQKITVIQAKGIFSSVPFCSPLLSSPPNS